MRGHHLRAHLKTKRGMRKALRRQKSSRHRLDHPHPGHHTPQVLRHVKPPRLTHLKIGGASVRRINVPTLRA